MTHRSDKQHKRETKIPPPTWSEQVRLWAPVAAAVGTLLAAGAAWRSAHNSAKASRVSAQAAAAAMLGVIPLPHPSVDLQGGATIKNRGATEAVSINWRIVYEGDENQPVARDSFTKVLLPGASRVAIDPPNADLAPSLKERRHVFIVEYQTPWGEQYTVRRVLRRAETGKRVNGDIEVIDAAGRVMRLADASN